MSDHKNNNSLDIDSGIDKYDGSFEKEESGCTILINKTVQNIKKLEVAGLYLYLMCRPPSWKLNVKHLASYFGCNKDKIYTIIDSLIDAQLLTRTETRHKGKFVSYKYRVHLRPKPKECVQNAPVLEKPDTVKPDTENPDAYKTKNAQNKEDINHIDHSYSATDVAQKQKSTVRNSRKVESDKTFDVFWNLYPVKKNKIRAKKIWDRKGLWAMSNTICKNVQDRIAEDAQWQDKQFIPHPSTFLQNDLWDDDIIKAKPKTQAANSSDAMSRVINKYSNQSGNVYDQNGNAYDALN